MPATDLQGETPKYPSKELTREWMLEAPLEGRSEYYIRKACDWQREQDALICDNLPIGNFEQGQYECATAIRSGGSHAD